MYFISIGQIRSYFQIFTSQKGQYSYLWYYIVFLKRFLVTDESIGMQIHGRGA